MADLRAAAAADSSDDALSDPKLYAALRAKAAQLTSLEGHARTAQAKIMQAAVQAVREGQWEAAQLAQRHHDAYLAEHGVEPPPMWMAATRQVSISAVVQSVGITRQGSPFRNLDALSSQQIDGIGQQIVRGVARGQHPSTVARQIVNNVVGVPMARAQTIARTELLRAYRGSTLQSMQDDGVTTGWIWRCSRSATTCAACWAMDGTEFDLDQDMDAHPNCMCYMEPQIPSVASITGDDSVGDLPSAYDTTGPEAFAQLPASTQQMILGARYADYAAGRTTLADMVQVRRSAQWGNSVTVASAKQARLNAA